MEARQEHRGTHNQIRVKPDAGIRDSTAYRLKSTQRVTSSHKTGVSRQGTGQKTKLMAQQV
jgi:hypothetical protein